MKCGDVTEELTFVPEVVSDDSDERRVPFVKAIAAVLRPARVALDGAIVPGGTLEAIDRAAANVAAALSTVTSVGVAIERCQAPAIGDAEVSLAVDFECEGMNVRMRLDLAAARTIVDAVAAGWTGLCGEGPLTETESGLLEYVLLRTLDLFERGRGRRGGAVKLVAIRSRRELGATDADDSLRIGLAVTVGGRRGRADLCFADDPRPLPLWRFAPSTLENARTGTVDVFVELPAVRVAEEELGECRPGDLLLLGMRDLGASPTPALLVTATGWQVARVRTLDTSATVMRVRVSELEIAPADESSFAAEDLLLRPRLGLARWTLAELRRLSEGACLDLSLRGGGVVDLAYGEAIVGSAELVRHDGELALRLLALDHAALGES